MTTPTSTGAVHARWDDLPRDAPMPQLTRARLLGEHAMLSEIRLDAGCTVPRHEHENEQFACVQSGAMRFVIGGDGPKEGSTLTVRAGEVLYLPANVPHSAEALEDSVVLDVFSPPSERTGVDRGDDA